MHATWFVRWGWFYRPVSLMGVLVLVLALAFAVQVFMAVDAGSHSVSDTLYGIFPYYVGLAFLVDWLASRTSGQGEQGHDAEGAPPES